MTVAMNSLVAALAAVAVAALLAGCASPAAPADPEAPPAPAPDGLPFQESTSGGTRLLVVSTQADGLGASTDSFDDGDAGFPIPPGSRHVRVEAVVEGPAATLDWELALHGDCDAEPAGETHTVGPSPLRLEFGVAELAGASCAMMYVLLQAADDPMLPASATVAGRATWTAEVEHPVI